MMSWSFLRIDMHDLIREMMHLKREPRNGYYVKMTVNTGKEDIL